MENLNVLAQRVGTIIVGPPLGKLAIIPSSLPQANFNQAAVLIRPLLYKTVLTKYLFIIY